jgi:hypothetical protein
VGEGELREKRKTTTASIAIYGVVQGVGLARSPGLPISKERSFRIIPERNSNEGDPPRKMRNLEPSAVLLLPHGPATHHVKIYFGRTFK